jgi:hypothetical protein
MQLWSRSVTPDGLATALVGPATLPELAVALDPQTNHVLFSEHVPIAGTGWTEALVPLTADVALQPTRLRISRLRYDALFETQEFLQTVDQISQFGARVRQFTKLPRADVNFDDP